MHFDQLIAAYREAGQGQVFAFWDQLDAAERRELADQAAEVDLDEIRRLFDTLVRPGAGAGTVSLEGLAPAPYIALPEHGGDPARWARARATGEAALRAGRVAAFTVAGGQGTRLGYDGPKGTFAVTPVRRKPLFQVFAEKILAAGRRYGKPLHWFIMTSHANHEQTEAFFSANGYFGLEPGRVHFFRQGRMPAVDRTGRIMLESRSRLALSPDGHGGSLRALHRSGALDLMQAEGITTISYFQVDNPLVRCLDPAFIGFHLEAGAEMSSKMIPKAYPEEKVGHFCLQHGEIVVIEYSDMPAAVQNERLPDGSLRFLAGSIAIHVIEREFARKMAGSVGGAPAATAGNPAVAPPGAPLGPLRLASEDGDLKPGVRVVPLGKADGGRSRAAGERTNQVAQPGADNRQPPTGSVAPALPFHRAEKKINTIDEAGNPVKPAKPNGVKFEMFVFDALPFAKNSIVVETARQDDFSPVKNAEGVDSPQTARDDQLRQAARWLRAVGVELATDATGLPEVAIEVSPLFADEAGRFVERWRALPAKPQVSDGLYLE
ncbi:MAG TPA: UDPGP type 1 family protein [Lacunisphaera sp.]|jgi:UDP-N-acetylglucosamine/UDP-N-acetylgalactosamine diphosphorylase|nr:UDPGP type 1 family protein [Lacunisphaera sp.]